MDEHIVGALARIAIVVTVVLVLRRPSMSRPHSNTGGTQKVLGHQVRRTVYVPCPDDDSYVWLPPFQRLDDAFANCDCGKRWWAETGLERLTRSGTEAN
ncbi:hypothetical protein BN971_01856 [Mycobacterium bohemicum DSM 44277]|uniref:Uncharacterized protein n=1 Tax=Mycobacterium bohemicum DSM 44277 TaxID=1236609 RepID=A0A0U0W6Z4_MYCBE|nr:hypothetical protein [Mycobacterium bohemicum]MCV6970063.1 hypothetical protein [Mycobacterium bohemicum]CPR10441.1 hypothetical protein BN971_01856 [Mycobacterium bohemicum DSM 44277]